MQISILDYSSEIDNIVIQINGVIIVPEISVIDGGISVNYLPDFGWYSVF